MDMAFRNTFVTQVPGTPAIPAKPAHLRVRLDREALFAVLKAFISSEARWLNYARSSKLTGLDNGRGNLPLTHVPTDRLQQIAAHNVRWTFLAGPGFRSIRLGTLDAPDASCVDIEIEYLEPNQHGVKIGG